MTAASKAADTARKNGGTIAVTTTLADAQKIVAAPKPITAPAPRPAQVPVRATKPTQVPAPVPLSAPKPTPTPVPASKPTSAPTPVTAHQASFNAQIVQAKQNYADAQKSGNTAAMAAASKVADAARKNGGTIGATTTLADAQKIVAAPTSVTKSVGTTYSSQAQKLVSNPTAGTKLNTTVSTYTSATVSQAQSANTGITYTSQSAIIDNKSRVGASLNVIVNKITSTQINQPTTNALSPNDQILKAKEDYAKAAKIGDRSAMAAAANLAEDARKNGGTISKNVTLVETQKIVANEQILQAKQDYASAAKTGDKTAMAEAIKLAEDARKNGGTISSNATLKETKKFIANDQILQAKQDYAIAIKAGDRTAMAQASKLAEDARKNGGTIASTVTLEQTKEIVANDQIIRAKQDYAIAQKAGDKAGMATASKLADEARKNGGTIASTDRVAFTEPMDNISEKDQASLIEEAKKAEEEVGIDAQIDGIDKELALLEKQKAELIKKLDANNKNIAAQKEELTNMLEDIELKIKKEREINEKMAAARNK